MNGNLWLRAGVALALLLGGWVSLRAFESHVQAPGPLPDVALAKVLADLPLQLGDWQGADRPIDDPKTLYADEHLQRVYVHSQTRQAVLVWGAYSKLGVDRGHHPEVCMAVAGRAEDPTQRAAFAAPGHAAPIQQYRFGVPGDRQWVFYWHYTLMPPKGAKITELQRFYQRLHRRPSSVTLEVFAPEATAADGPQAKEFALLLDAALQAHLGPTAIRGSHRMPVTVIQGEDPAAQAADE